MVADLEAERGGPEAGVATASFKGLLPMSNFCHS